MSFWSTLGGLYKKANSVDAVALQHVSGDIWLNIQTAVHIAEKDNIPGAEKRKAVIDMIERAGIAVMGYALNLCIELAVAKIRNAA